MIRTLDVTDCAVLAIFFFVNLAVGWHCTRKNKTGGDFMLGGGRTPWWAAALSYYATAASSISFMAVPAKTYASDWLTFGSAPAQIIATFVVAVVFVGLLRRLNITTVFEYLEFRFGLGVRLLGALLTVLLKIFGRISVVMLLPALALSTVTGMNVYWSTLAMGVVTIVYCAYGGFEAVIWTDVLQVAIMWGGLLLAFGIIVHRVPGGMAAVFQVASTHGKLHAISWDLNVREPTVWVFVGMGLASIFVQLSDQPLMQRVFSTPDAKLARRTVVIGGILAIPSGIITFALGTFLYAYFQAFPAQLAPVANDAIFPYFIVHELPHGVRGLLLASLFASAMGALSSALNSAATIMVTDGYGILRPHASEGQRVRAGRVATVVAGVIGTAMAAYVASLGVSSLWDQFIKLIALIGGGLPGVFALGLLTRRATAAGVTVGVLASIGVTWWVQTFTSVNVFLHGFVAVGSCIVIGYGASLLWGRPLSEAKLSGLTLRHSTAPRKTEPVHFVRGEPVVR